MYLIAEIMHVIIDQGAQVRRLGQQLMFLQEIIEFLPERGIDQGVGVFAIYGYCLHRQRICYSFTLLNILSQRILPFSPQDLYLSTESHTMEGCPTI